MNTRSARTPSAGDLGEIGASNEMETFTKILRIFFTIQLLGLEKNMSKMR
jgi:hypothetical protein